MLLFSIINTPLTCLIMITPETTHWNFELVMVQKYKILKPKIWTISGLFFFFFSLRDLLTASAADFTFIFCQTSVPGSLIYLVFLFFLIRLFGILLNNFMDFRKFLEIPLKKVFCFKLKGLSVYMT